MSTTIRIAPTPRNDYRGVALRRRPLVFSSVEAARRSLHIGGYTSAMWIVLGDHDGDHGEALLVCPADASRLVRAGYELV